MADGVDPGAVDAWIEAKLLESDPALDAALAANEAGGLPAIDVAPVQGKLLHLLARIAGARRILEIGTLGGYSTIWLARALPPEGRLVTLELEPHHATVAEANLARAGVADRCAIRVGPAADSLAALQEEAQAPFDLVFIDADKEGNVAYLRAALVLSRPGTVIVVDNVVRAGGVLDPASDDPRIIGTRALYDAVAAEPRLSATALQTIGAKPWDGFLIALVTG
ncbi:putative O-methyltransferase YrrM [Sphingomonas naasensis]|uniref:O-methyltransferase n=1 Tax=Sphingomonas naasensis TaxID=1344951 RepID=A0A4S1WN03_9SPHN|nr:O-methyltransferase [Sphingomonas naasensis]NIJ20085.1 putative O-methyltransferase YrrM [Sphingomonas naasensis]TGX44243.1 O-methyltransferase [Sphingomonas naasensis]